ncbi:major histocompatibility complex class I ZBA [Pimephales promelas]|nr:major histocompatibility complex class I ZBA [Pimephales promelas]
MGLLDDSQIDYYNSEEKRKIPTQRWIEGEIRKLKRHSVEKEQRTVWRHGCEVEQQGSQVNFLKGVSEYGYDGENFLSFDYLESQWVAPVEAALPTKRKWDNVPILNQYTKGYLEKECGDWLNKFREFRDKELRKGCPPKVHMFERKNTNDETKLKLTCLATGFYPKEVMMIIMKYRTSLPDDEIESSGVRPNHDGSYQLRKSVEIKKEERDEYDCLVSHKSIKEPIRGKWGQATESLSASLKKEPDGRECVGETADASATVALEKVLTERHSLYYIYTSLSKRAYRPGIYEFSAMGLLDDRQIDYYNSEEKRKIPTQRWMKEKMPEDYWEKGTQSRKSKEQWFNVNIKILMDRMGHNDTDLHVFQWRTGCEVEQQGSQVNFLKGISEYGYDGENFLSFDDLESQWVAPVEAALPTKRKWDNVPILNQYTKGYLEKECVDWLNKFREYRDEELRNGPPPKVHMFAKKSIGDKTKLKLTCLANGFYPKDLRMTIRKYCTSLPDDEIESSGVRPNHDGSYQLRKSVEIKEEERHEYDCLVSHKSIKEPIIGKLGN